ncbi:MAG: PLP-dependent aminotransferase family protein [Thermoprotei archaeon]
MNKLVKPPDISPVEYVSRAISGLRVLNLAAGSPDPTTIPSDEIRETYSDILREYGAEALGYPGAGGLDELKAELPSWCRSIGVDTAGMRFVVTSGAQHAISLIAASVQPSYYIHEEPTFIETLNSFKATDAKGLSIPMDNDGIIAREIERKLGRRKVEEEKGIIYTIPLAHNPTGVSMKTSRRTELAEIAKSHKLLMVEDDPYRPIYPSPESPILNEAPDSTVYVSSFSKAVAPGLRVGFVATRMKWLADRITALEQLDFSTSSINQLVLAKLLRSGKIYQKLDYAKKLYRRKMNVLLDALADNRFELLYQPSGGLYALVDLGVDSQSLLAKALQKGVAYVPGVKFFQHATPMAKRSSRLSVGKIPLAQIDEAVNTLGKVAHRLGR